MDAHLQTAAPDNQLAATSFAAINRCNLPACVLGSLTFQRHPSRLVLDGVAELHRALFQELEALADPRQRAQLFQRHMRAGFLLDHLEEAGLADKGKGKNRGKVDYLRLLRGWLFDADGREAAVLKAWVESRFGLLTRNHRGLLDPGDASSCPAFWRDRCKGLYNSNALEAQLDLLFSYCQYELARRFPRRSHIRLHRGVNRIDEHLVLERPARNRYVLLLNNLNSFSDDRDRAGEFGDYILDTDVPLSKLLYLPELLPGTLRGENEYLVVGGIYQVQVSTL
jgi:NAD+--dinitrogen-reductase ADP-D-ribosyltransferase